jgi:diguanylate cyclase (GGDEF)-like protein/PAS domain S-box-containing protein
MTEEKEILEELLAAALCSLEDGIAVLDDASRVLVWNPAATAISGYQSADLLRRALPVTFYEVDAHHLAAHHLAAQGLAISSETTETVRAVLVNLRHSQGHALPAMLRRTPLRDALGRRIGTLLRFHPVEEVDALPHGVLAEDSSLDKQVEHSQADMEDRLDEAWQEWTVSAVPFGLLWITVDQAAMLRKTHGRDASEAMLAIMERTLLHALRPTEILGRWGSNEFLVLSHERTSEMLAHHARHVCDLARTADFRWWGDRVALTVSIGAAQASQGQDEKLGSVLRRAQRAMQAGEAAGGNTVVLQENGKNLSGNGAGNGAGNGGLACSQS